MSSKYKAHTRNMGADLAQDKKTFAQQDFLFKQNWYNDYEKATHFLTYGGRSDD